MQNFAIEYIVEMLHNISHDNSDKSEFFSIWFKCVIQCLSKEYARIIPRNSSKLIFAKILTTSPKPKPSICTMKRSRRLAAAIALSHSRSSRSLATIAWCPADVFATSTRRCRCARANTFAKRVERREKGWKKKGWRGRERRKRAGGASIYQRRREVGGCMRRIAPYGRSLINSGRRQSSGASVHRPTTWRRLPAFLIERRRLRAERSPLGRTCLSGANTAMASVIWWRTRRKTRPWIPRETLTLESLPPPNPSILRVHFFRQPELLVFTGR